MKKLITILSLLFSISFGTQAGDILWLNNSYALPSPTTGNAPGLLDGESDFSLHGGTCSLISDANVKSITLHNNELIISNSSTITIETNLELTRGSKLIIKSGATLELGGIINNNDQCTIVIEVGANLIQTDITCNNTGTGAYSIEVVSHSKPEEYNFWSSPTHPSSLASTFSNAQKCDIYYYNTDNNEWRRPSNHSNCNSATVADGDNNTKPGQGYAIAGAGTTVFNGIINNGKLLIPISQNGSGKNLIGNPYPSSISAKEFLTQNKRNIDGSLYFWLNHKGKDSHLDKTLDYATLNLAGATGHPKRGGGFPITPNGTIAVGQGFFVTATSNSNLEFSNSMRVRNNSTFYKSDTDFKRIWISASSNKKESQLLITFNENATEKEDWGYDSKRQQTNINNNKSAFSFGTILENNPEPYAIQSFSDLDLETEREVPLSIYTSTSEVTCFKIDHIENIDPSIIITIFDKATGKSQNLRNGPFAVYLNANETYNNRFTILFKNSKPPSPHVGIEKLNDSFINLYYNNNSLYLNNIVAMDELSIYTTTGRLILNSSLNSSFEKNIPVNNLSKGIYIAVIKNIDGTIEAKKFITQ